MTRDTGPQAIDHAPRVHVACAVCDGEERRLVTSEEEIEAQRRYLRLFHLRRVRPGSTRALEERAEFTQDYATRVVECIVCGLLYRDPRPRAAAIADAYAGDEYGAARLESLFASQLELFRPKAGELRRQLPTGAQPLVLEVGSFVGGFLMAMREQGARVIGLDPGAEVVDFCRAKGLDVVRGVPEDCATAAAQADCITVWNTFDQLPQPQKTLAVLKRLLRPGGLLVLRVPNGACFRRASVWLRRAPRVLRPWLTATMAWNNLLAFPYLHGYSLDSLDRLLGRFSFERVGFRPDVLTRLSDVDTKAWAAQEEKLLKAVCRVAARLDLGHGVRGARIAPWFDAYYRLVPRLQLVR